MAAERVPGSILDTKLEDRGGRAVYTVEIQTVDQRLEAVQVDARDARVLRVDEVSDPGLVGEVEAPWRAVPEEGRHPWSRERGSPRLGGGPADDMRGRSPGSQDRFTRTSARDADRPGRDGDAS